MATLLITEVRFCLIRHTVILQTTFVFENEPQYKPVPSKETVEYGYQERNVGKVNTKTYKCPLVRYFADMSGVERFTGSGLGDKSKTTYQKKKKGSVAQCFSKIESLL